MTGTTLSLGLLIGSVGAGYFIYGKKQQKFLPMLSGIGLFLVPYLISNLLLLSGVSLVFCLLPLILRTD